MQTVSASASAPLASPSVRAPVHLWVVGVLSLLWNAVGAMDYTMTQFQVEAYLGTVTAEQLAYINGFPAWAVAFWAFGVWGSFFGSVALLLRRAWAVWLFGVSIIGLMGTSLYTYVLSDGFAMMGGGIGQIAFSVAIWVITIALFLYARYAARRRILR